MFTLLFAVLNGTGLALQTAVNARLRGFVGSPFLAAAVSFSVGAVFLCLLAFASGQNLPVFYRIFPNAPFWVWIGGVLGAIGVTVNILIFPHLGGVQTAVMPLLGQILTGVFIDHFGWLRSPQYPLSMMRIFGVLLVLTGIFFAVVLPELKRNRNALNVSSNAVWLWRLLGVSAGVVTSIQAAVNGELARILHSSLYAALVSFWGGALVLILFTYFKEGGFGRIKQAFGENRPWWVWLGGVFGAVFVFGLTMLVPILGTGQAVIFSLSGLIVGSILVDKFGLFGVASKAILPIQLFGLSVLMGGVMLIRLF